MTLGNKLKRIGWKKGPGPNFYFPENGYPHFHLQIKNTDRAKDMEADDIIFLAFTYGGQRSNIQLVRNGKQTNNYDGGIQVVYKKVDESGQEMLDDYRAVILPLLNMAGYNTYPPKKKV